MADLTTTDPDKYRVIFENERVRVLEYRDEPGQKTIPHAQPFSLRRVDDVADVPKATWPEERKKFLSKAHPHLWVSALAKRFGWGIHNNAEGKIAPDSLASRSSLCSGDGRGRRLSPHARAHRFRPTFRRVARRRPHRAYARPVRRPNVRNV
jgi:hypothetical protein